MKKNKKLFAILTLVAFMMTLMPVMAFAATGTIDTATVAVSDDNTKIVFSGTGTTGDTVYIYALDGSKEVTGSDLASGATVANSKFSVEIAIPSTETSYVVAAAAKSASDSVAAADKTVTVTTEMIENAALATTIAPVVEAWNAYKAATGTAVAGKVDAFVNALDTAALSRVEEEAFFAKAGTNSTEVDAVYYVKAATVAYDAYAAAPNDNDLWKAFKDAYAKTTKAVFGSYKNDTALATTADKVANADTLYDAMDVVSGGSVLDNAVSAWESFYDNNTDANWKAFKKAYAVVNVTDFNNAVGAAEGRLAANVYDATSLGAAAKLVDAYKGSGSGNVADGKASADASIFATVDANAAVEVNGSAKKTFPTSDTQYADADIVLKQANNAAAAAQRVYVWAEEKSNQPSDALAVEFNGKVLEADNNNIYIVEMTKSTDQVKVAFVRAGSFSLKASLVAPNVENGVVKNTATFKSESKGTVKATALAQETRKFKVAVTTNNGDNVIDGALLDGEKTTDSVTVAADTVATTKVTLKVTNKDDKLMTTYPIKLSTNSGNIEVDKNSITTDYKGEATFNIAGLREGEYKVYVNIGDYEATILVTVGATSANSIELIKFPSNPIATDTLVADYKDVFRFQLTDANGNIVKGDNVRGARYASLDSSVPSSEKTSSEMAKYAAIISAPEANKVKNADLRLDYVADKDYYTLEVLNNKAFEAEGDYEVRVVLDNGKAATLNFTVKKFDKAVSLHIEYPTQAVELNSTTDAPDIYFLDANNVMKKANNRVTVAASGYAVAGIKESGADAGTLTVKNDEKYIGQTITVTAASDKENLMATTTLTVADEAREVKLDTARGQVNANNRVGFKVVDSTGHSVALGNDAKVEVTAVVANTGDKDAKVSYSVSGSSVSDLKSNGTGVINLSSNKETTATVQIMVKVSKNNKNNNSGDNNTGLSTTYYTGTETFTFGAEADKSVVMTIGSKEMVANNVPVTTDVAPFIQDSRTYVPFRALTEAFGAEVEYNAENNTVTTKLNGKTVVLTVGSTVLTVNDNTVTMDVAPFIVDDRVVVPVRFVGEAFGFTVEATQDANTGATASVVFYQK